VCRRVLNRRSGEVETHLVHPEPSPIAPTAPITGAGRRAGDPGGRTWAQTRELLLASLVAPVRPPTRVVTVLAGAVLLAETTGLVVRRACAVGSCSEVAGSWALRWDMDALGSVPRALITGLLAVAALGCLRGFRRAGHGGAAVWWAVLGAGCAALTVAKQTSLHSLVEGRLAGLLPGIDIQLLFVVTSLVGLLTVLVAGRWVRRETRTVVVTWLGLYALASVGLAAVTVVLAPLGSVVADLATWVEECGEGLAAVGLLAAVRVSTRDLGRRRPTPTTPNDHAP
ncbi:Hypothetical protein KLENKIAIHU_2786, partial [Klenkia terrae]